VGYGRIPLPGHLCVHSVCCEARAKELIVLSCEMGRLGEYVARELVQAQTQENLRAFGARLARTERMIKPCPHCEPE
jgi:hypothetical protein